MTTQPDPVHHLLDRLLRDVLLPEEREQLAGAVRILQARVNEQGGAASVAVSAVRLMNQAGAQRDAAEARVRELEAQVARLTPGTSPAEHCGHQIPALTKHTERTECVLRPGHHGSHATQHGARWWWISNAEATP
ncbi:hypothetical protein ACFU67_13315 [Streptomyces rhizosphaericola]|uniref:hypothetical protein n=1 Tax=Streptomyces rhizosphaericola TaxID=2564098 RepID=UPI0036BB0627